MKRFKKWMSGIWCMVIAIAMAFNIVGCTGKEQNEVTPATEEITSQEAAIDENATEELTTNEETAEETSKEDAQDVTVLGEGQTVFTFTVVDADLNETVFEIHTDKKTVGEALLELNLIEGEQGDYGLYVKTVNGISADYDKDGVYWAFYENGEYAMSGVDTTDITAGNTYSFKVEK